MDTPDVCAAFDAGAVAEVRSVSREEVEARIAAGQLPARLLPRACARGAFHAGRFVDPEGNVYRLGLVERWLLASPEARAEVTRFRRARVAEIVTVAVAVVIVPLGVMAPYVWEEGPHVEPPMNFAFIALAVPASATAGKARAALADAVAAYNAEQFWAEAERSRGLGLPAAVVETTRRVLDAMGCDLPASDPAFVAQGVTVWRYSLAGWEAEGIVAKARGATGCDVEAALAR